MIGSRLTLATGVLRGSERDAAGVLAFKGIPYAAPPVGLLRWRVPQPAAPWPGERDATAFGSSCFGSPLPGLDWMKANFSEDCLNLNVWTGATEPEERRPVMVWVHGGGFVFGSSCFPNTDGSRLASAGSVVVSFNYRLGVFGFLAHPELDAEGSASGNFGLRDQIAALLWVKHNIAAFGGDPDRVTLFGESAGAHAIGLLMAAPAAAGLFHRAIGQSGAWWDSEHGSIETREEARARGIALANRLGGGSVAKLRALPPEELSRKTAWNFLLDPGATAFAPNIDGEVVPISPGQTYAEGRQHKIPLLAGWNAEEHSYFGARALPAKPAAFRAAAARQFGPDAMAEFDACYPSADKAETQRSADTLIGDLVISEQTWEWLGEHRATGGAPVYGYQFDYESPYSPKALHTAEIPFIFGNLLPSPQRPKGLPSGAEDRHLSDVMIGYWTNFAASGDPNGPNLPHWPRYDGAGTQVMRFGATIAAQQESVTRRFQLLKSFRRAGRLPDSWRSAQGRLPTKIAPLVAKVVLALIGWKTRRAPPAGI